MNKAKIKRAIIKKEVVEYDLPNLKIKQSTWIVFGVRVFTEKIKIK